MPQSKTITQYADDLAFKLEPFFTKSLPALPDSVKEIIVKISPYLTLVLMVMFLPVLLGALGLGAIFMPFSFIGGLSTGFGYIVGLFFAFGATVLQLLALPGLFKREQKAWKYIFYANLLSLTHTLFSAQLGSFIFSALISLYFLFQVKAKYTK